MNCLSVLQYAVDFLEIEHVIVCGHYGCGGVIASIEDRPHGLVDNWLRHIRDIYQRHEPSLSQMEDQQKKIDRLCELNVIEQVINIANTTIVQDAWNRGQSLAVHGWIYNISDGLLQDLNVCLQSLEELKAFKP
jgi:carbonic anhydrase